MKLSIKNIIVVFLVALLGAGIGTYGVMSVCGYQKTSNTNSDNSIVINEVQYSNKKETSYTDAIDKAYNTVVEVVTKVQSSTSGYYYFNYGGTESSYSESKGSGVIISADGYIVTNEHVIDGAAGDDAVAVTLYNGNEYQATIVGYDTRTDLAVLKIDETDLPYSSFADSDQLKMGEDVIAIGNPLGAGITCSNGIISALGKEIYINNVYMEVIQTNAAVNAGNSGGGLFDINGNIVGIVNAKKSSTSTSETSVEGLGYAIPSNTVVKIVQELIENGYVKDRAALGIKVYTGNSYYTTSGVVISEVIEGGSADKAGLQANDVITAIDDNEVKSYADLSKYLDSKAIGDVVKVTVSRNSKMIDVEVTLQQSTN